MPTPSRLPETRRLTDILPAGREGGLEFARIVDLLLFHEARRNGRTFNLFSDRAGDYGGMDSFADSGLRVISRVGYQYKFYPSPLSNEHRSGIKAAIVKAQEAQQGRKQRHRLTKLVVVTPDGLTESGRREGGGDVTWFDGLATELGCKFALEHWGHRKLQALFLDTPALCLFYYPELVPDGRVRRRSIDETRQRYDRNMQELYGRIEFVGMSVYKPEATHGVPMEHIYIPVATVPEQADDRNEDAPRENPLELLHPPGGRTVILGDPGSGKSTLLKFLTLAGRSEPLQDRYDGQPDRRLPILVVLRRYSDALKDDPDLSLLDYIVRNLRADLSLPHLDQAFLEYYLESGEAILLFDGMDELPNPRFKKKVRTRVHCLLNTYPGNTSIITSRIVGYENSYRFDDKGYRHLKLARLALPEMERFVADWYAVRVENPAERQANVDDLNRILRDTEQEAIRELAANPLLLTIIALVHRIDAVLPDERVVLYQKCTETLLNTWHTWKFRAAEVQARRGKIERRNRARIEALAHWMHRQAGSADARERSVVSFEQARDFLTDHIRQHERLEDPDDAPDLAEDFLEFVKSRAGLLIEVGDRQFSFVHLTFQEYLTATYMAARMEVSGADALLAEIGPLVSDARWHEVIRLLIAGLRSADSQALLVSRLVDPHGTRDETHVALLLGGLLLDGIEAAELERAGIAERLLRGSINETEPQWIRRILGQIRALVRRSRDQEPYFEDGFQRVWRNASEAERHALLLAGFASGFPEPRLKELTDGAIYAEGYEWQRILLSSEPEDEWPAHILNRLDLFYSTLSVYASTSQPLSELACLAESVIPSSQLPKRAFLLRLFLAAGGYEGPYRSFGIAGALLHSPERIYIEPDPDQFLYFQFRHTVERAILAAKRRQIGKSQPVLKPGLKGLHTLASKRAAAFSHRHLDKIGELGRENIWPGFETELVALLLDKPALGEGDSRHLWTMALNDPRFLRSLTDLLLVGLDLDPIHLWREALQHCFLPKISQRLRLYRPDTWERTTARFAEGGASMNDHFAAAWMLLHDLWFHFEQNDVGSDESPFADLARLTRDVDHPALRVAHCLRDLAYGDEDRADDLAAMVGSDDPAYQELFREAMWID
jgi:energy-coupling factor transporter ATP-binding protein EcfA2